MYIHCNYFSSTTVDTSENIHINYTNVLPFHLANDDELDIFYNVTKNTRKSWYNTITELEKLIIAKDNYDQSIISKIDPDLNILYYINDAIQNSSRYYDTSSFRDTFKNLTNKLSILNVNIRGMRTNREEKTSFQKKSYFMINSEIIENDIRISNEFNNYVVSVGSTLASKINVNCSNPLDYIQSNVQAWPYLIIMKMMSHLQLIISKIVVWVGIIYQH